MFKMMIGNSNITHCQNQDETKEILHYVCRQS